MILIKNSLLVDGTGKPPVRRDILIKGDTIAAIGNFKQHAAETVIDGVGMRTLPGFIDVNTDSDHYLSLFTDPQQQDFLLQGVTTIIGGHCGSSLAPLLYGTLESIRKWANISNINVDWNTLSEFLAVLERIKLGVNFGTLVGHSTVRRAILGEDLRDLTERELLVLEHILEEALKEGALGISTGLAYSHSKMTPYAELIRIGRLVKKYEGVYSTHLRNEREDLVGSVGEVISISKDTGAKLLISHFRPILGYEDQFAEALGLIEKVDNGTIHFDAYPFDYSILPIYTLLPEWAKTGNLEHMLEQLQEDHIAEEIFKSLPQFKNDELIIARAPGFDYLVGKTIGQFAKGQGMPIKKGLLRLMKITQLKAVLFYRNIKLPLALDALLSEHALVASNSPSLLAGNNVIENDRAKFTFSRFLEFAQKQERKIEWAVHKITGAPAQKFNLARRGVLAEGNIADIVLLRDGAVQHVLVSGQIVVHDKNILPVRAGKILRR